MERWIGKVAVVTGASAGIGAAIVIDLVKAGMIVIGLARREDRILELEKFLPKNCAGKLYAKKCDLTNEENVKSVFKWIEQKFSCVHVLVNNAGILRDIFLLDKKNLQTIREVIDTNLIGVVLCIHESFDLMKKNNFNGHIIIINSVVGHKVPYFGNVVFPLNIYPCTKHALTAMVEVLRQEFNTFNNQTKITSISPGFVRTEIFNQHKDHPIPDAVPQLESEDVSAAVLYALGTPPRVQVHELTLKVIGEQF